MSSPQTNHDPEQIQPTMYSRTKGVNPFVLLFSIIIIFSVLSYIVPAGQYERTEQDGRTVIDPNSFQFIESTPVGLLDIFNSIHLGMIEGAPIIFFVLVFGGALGILNGTGAINAFIQYVPIKFKNKELLLIPIMTLVFALLGAMIGSAEDALVYIAIITPLVLALGFDKLTAFAIVFVGMSMGFTAGITNPFNVGVAQTVAELPTFSGMGLRIILFIALYGATVSYIYLHVMRIKKNPSLGVFGNEEERAIAGKGTTVEKLTVPHKAILSLLLVTFIIMIYGVISLGWFITEIASIFLMLSIIASIIVRKRPNEIADHFVSGCADMIKGALIIGIAYGVLVILEEGNLIDTILYYSANMLEGLPPLLSTIGFFAVQSMINFFVPSGSGQAALTMPLMTPLADMIGVTRQTAVLAFQLGDGVSKVIFPTSATLMAGLAIAGIPYGRYVRWVLPLVLINATIGCIFLIVAQIIGYGPY
ncbi:YfcC family protein [Geomicrobium sp. JSM 1781026]|uniref:YfcC family protein n=1 Tax=Geomicrobium sp. JSM 1781026 TaxID=3344580 RepID=UPI0035C0C092